ncbi:MAG: hypothetical protein ABSC19_06225 [Syntrophorhabdales bacterium]|jgi:tetratricopeptide (TPR) repeat protein
MLIAAFVWPHLAEATQRRAKRQGAGASSSPAASAGVNDVNLNDYFKAGEEDLKKGRADQAVRIFQAIHSYTGESLELLTCVGEAYEKALKEANLDQNQREDLYLKTQRMTALTTRYTKLKADSAYYLGLAYARKGDSAQARKYLLETCRTVPFSLDPASVWMKSKNLLLSISNLDGEF